MATKLIPLVSHDKAKNLHISFGVGEEKFTIKFMNRHANCTADQYKVIKADPRFGPDKLIDAFVAPVADSEKDSKDEPAE